MYKRLSDGASKLPLELRKYQMSTRPAGIDARQLPSGHNLTEETVLGVVSLFIQDFECWVHHKGGIFGFMLCEAG